MSCPCSNEPTIGAMPVTPCGCVDPVGPSMPAGGCVPLGSIVPAGLVSAAEEVADFLGLDLDDLFEDGVDAVLSILGIGTCSDKNKAKYRRMVAEANDSQLQAWLRARKVGGATESCNEYALAIAARRVQGKVREAQRRAESIRSRMRGPFATQADCMQALRNAGLGPGDTALRVELARDCNRWGGAPAPCTVPMAVQVAGVSSEGWCILSDAQRADLMAGIESVELSDADRRRLLALPIGERREAFLRLAKKSAEGWPTWVKILIVLAIVGAIAGAVFALKGDG